VRPLAQLIRENFLADMGPKPSPKHSLDRIDNDGNYEPGNCEWVTLSVQRSNIRGGVWEFLRRTKGEAYVNGLRKAANETD
jgi:hypothetical protein